MNQKLRNQLYDELLEILAGEEVFMDIPNSITASTKAQKLIDKIIALFERKMEGRKNDYKYI